MIKYVIFIYGIYKEYYNAKIILYDIKVEALFCPKKEKTPPPPPPPVVMRVKQV